LDQRYYDRYNGWFWTPDPRLIVALALAETQGGTNMNWGPYNAWNIGVRNPNYKGPNKQPPYSGWDQSIAGISTMIGTSTLYLGSNPNMTTAQLYKKCETTKKYKRGLGNLNTALAQMGGSEGALTNSCNPKNLRSPNQ
jgi:hypothetical protein